MEINLLWQWKLPSPIDYDSYSETLSPRFDSRLRPLSTRFAKFLFLVLELFRFSPLLASLTSAKPHNSTHTIKIKLIYINLIWFKSTVIKSSVNLGLLLKVTPPTPILCLYICLCMQPSHYFILFTRDSEFIFALHYSTLQQFILLTRGSEFIFIFHQFTFQ